MEAAYAGFALLDADDGFAGCDGVGVAMAKDRNVDPVIKRVADVASAIAFGYAQSTQLLSRPKLEQRRAQESASEARFTAVSSKPNQIHLVTWSVVAELRSKAQRVSMPRRTAKSCKWQGTEVSCTSARK